MPIPPAHRHLLALPRHADGPPRATYVLDAATLERIFTAEERESLGQGLPVRGEHSIWVDLVAYFDATCADPLKAAGEWVIA